MNNIIEKECEVVMLPTEDIVPVGDYFINFPPHDWGRLEYLKCERLTSMNHMWNGDGIKTNQQHLYILSNEEIKEGDWCIVNQVNDIGDNPIYELGKLSKIGKRGIHYFNELSICFGEHELDRVRKVIATTDESLMNTSPYPRPSNEFLKKFCEVGGINDILVEYEDYDGVDEKGWLTSKYKTKVAPDNTITIKPIQEKLYTKEEVDQKVRFLSTYLGQKVVLYDTAVRKTTVLTTNLFSKLKHIGRTSLLLKPLDLLTDEQLKRVHAICFQRDLDVSDYQIKVSRTDHIIHITRYRSNISCEEHVGLLPELGTVNCNFHFHKSEESKGESFKRNIGEIHVSSQRFVPYIRLVDYLRSEGFAIEWDGISVKGQIERGWVKLKTK